MNKKHSRASVRPYRKYLMGPDGTYRQVGSGGVFRVVSNHIPHGRRSCLLLAPLLVLQARAGGPPGHAEDILRRTLRTGIQSGCLYLRTLHDFAIDASIVTTTLPIVTMIVAAIYLKEPVTNKKVLGIFVGAMGAFILIMSSQTTGAGNGSLIGDLLCLLAQISFSIYLTVFKGLSQKYSPITLNKWMFVYASMCYIPFSYHDVAAIQWSEISTAALLQVGYVVVGGSFLAYIFIMSAQRLLRPTVVSMYNYMQPIVASTVAIILGLGVFNWKGNSHSLGIPGSVHRDTKQVTQGFRERRESRIKQPFHRHSTPARTRLRDSGVINR